MEQMFESSVRGLQCLSPYTPPPPRSLRQIKQRKRPSLMAVFGSLDRDKSPRMVHFIMEELENMEKGDLCEQVR